MNDDEAGGSNLPEQWWILALIAAAPFFLYYWIADNQYSKGLVLGCVVGGIVISSGFYIGRLRSPVFWSVTVLLTTLQLPPLMLLSIPNIHGPSFGFFFPIVAAEGVLTYFAFKYAFIVFDRSQGG